MISLDSANITLDAESETSRVWCSSWRGLCIIWILCDNHVFGSPWLLSTCVSHASTSSSVHDASARGDRSARNSGRVHRFSACRVIRGTRVPVWKSEGSIETDKAQIISSLAVTLRFDGALNVDVTNPRTIHLSDVGDHSHSLGSGGYPGQQRMLESCSASTLSREDGSTTLYDCMTDVISEVSLHWTIDSSVVHVAISKTSDSGYLALGVPDSAGAIVASDAFIASDGTVETYRIIAYSSAGVSQSSISVEYSEASVTVFDGATTLRIVDMKLSDLTSVDLIWAYHADSLTYHGTNRGAMNVNFESGVAAAIDIDTVQKSVVQAHAIMALTAWGWLAPFAVAVKAIGTGIGSLKEIQIFGFPVAFLAHVFLMLCSCKTAHPLDSGGRGGVWECVSHIRFVPPLISVFLLCHRCT